MGVTKAYRTKRCIALEAVTTLPFFHWVPSSSHKREDGMRGEIDYMLPRPDSPIEMASTCRVQSPAQCSRGHVYLQLGYVGLLCVVTANRVIVNVHMAGENFSATIAVW